MSQYQKLIFAVLATLCASDAFAQSNDDFVDNSKVVALTRFLEAEPLNKNAPVVRGLLLKWEEKSTDVVDVVCPSMFKSLLNKETPFQSELLAQFVIGSAAYQIENPLEKGKLIPQQLAGMRSLLKTYRAYQSGDPKVHIPELDEFAKHESAGTLSQFMEPLIATECRS